MVVFFNTVIYFQVSKSDINNLQIDIWFQVFLSSNNKFQTDLTCPIYWFITDTTNPTQSRIGSNRNETITPFSPKL